MNQILEFIFYGFSLNFTTCGLLCWPAMAAYIFIKPESTKNSEISDKMRKTILKRALLFSVAKLLAVLLMATLFYLAGGTAKILFGQYKSIFNVVAGSVIAMLGISLLIPTHSKINTPHKNCARHLGDKNGVNSTIKNVFMLGFAYGAAPCAPKVAILAFAAVSSQNFYQLVQKTIAFSIGELTAPFLMWGLGMVTSNVSARFLTYGGKQLFWEGVLKKITAALLVFSGIRFFFI